MLANRLQRLSNIDKRCVKMGDKMCPSGVTIQLLEVGLLSEDLTPVDTKWTTPLMLAHPFQL